MSDRKITLQGRTLTGLAAGAVGGVISWLLIEKTGWFSLVLDNPEGVSAGSRLYWLQVTLGGLFGLVIAMSLAVVVWVTSTKSYQPARTIVLGSVAGLAGGAFGMMVGQWVYTRIASGGSDSPGPTTQQLLIGVLARALGWALVGSAVGAAQGITRGSWRASRLGAVGGFMGGLGGGGVFEALEVVASNPVAARLSGFIFIGAAIGFFLEMIPYLMKQAWIKVESGKGAGSEYILDKTWTTIGRSELADIPLYGNRAVAPIHCTIEATPSSSILRPIARLANRSNRELAEIRIDDLVVSDDRVLQGGEAIQIADWTLKFNTRSVKVDAASIQPVPKPAVSPAPQRDSISKVPPAAFEPLKNAPPLLSSDVGQVASSRRISPDGLTGGRLVCLEGSYYGQVYSLGLLRTVTIGRAPEQDIALSSDPGVSRNHAVIRLSNGRHQLEDLKSVNGTFLNELQLTPHDPKVLKLGDLIRIGDSVLKYE